MTTTSGPEQRTPSPAMPKPVLLAIIGVLLLVVAASVFGLTRLSGDGAQADESILKSFTPGANDKIPQQGQVRVELMTGWDGALRIDQIDIPREQLTRNQEDRVASYQTLIFQPGAGKALEYFPPGQNCVVATYWQLANPSQRFVKEWCFSAF